jgi:excisionase family DNA binding protein
VRGCRETPPVGEAMLLTIKDLSRQLNIKPSTLYLWAAQGKIPCQKIHGLIRFDPEAITMWLRSFEPTHATTPQTPTHNSALEADRLIEAATRAVYTPGHGETITPSPTRKE